MSVVRGEGPLTGEPCIDDYIRATEPIFDYMTKWSGLVWLRPHVCTRSLFLKVIFPGQHNAQ